MSSLAAASVHLLCPQIDAMLDSLHAIIDGTTEGMTLAGLTSDAVEDLNETSAEVTRFREEEVEGTLDILDQVLRMVSTIAMAVGGVLMGIALFGFFAAALLVCHAHMNG